MARVCVICSVSVEHRRVDAEVCGKECQVKRDTTKRRDSGRLRKANMDAEQYARRRAKAREYFSNQRAQGKDKVTWACVTCGNTFKVKRYSEAGYWCSQRCQYNWRRGINLSNSKDLARIKKHARKIQVKTVRGGQFFAGNCVICESPFVSRYPDKTCSPLCQNRNHRRGEFREWITPRDRYRIYRRDCWVCQICYEPVSQDMPWVNDKWQPEYPSLDHIVPRSQGGKDTAENLRLAHFKCNWEKADTPY